MKRGDLEEIEALECLAVFPTEDIDGGEEMECEEIEAGPREEKPRGGER